MSPDITDYRTPVPKKKLVTWWCPAVQRGWWHYCAPFSTHNSSAHCHLPHDSDVLINAVNHTSDVQIQRESNLERLQ